MIWCATVHADWSRCDVGVSTVHPDITTVHTIVPQSTPDVYIDLYRVPTSGKNRGNQGKIREIEYCLKIPGKNQGI